MLPLLLLLPPPPLLPLLLLLLLPLLLLLLLPFATLVGIACFSARLLLLLVGVGLSLGSVMFRVSV
jgi:hypothetical protein